MVVAIALIVILVAAVVLAAAAAAVSVVVFVFCPGMCSCSARSTPAIGAALLVCLATLVRVAA